MFPLMVLLYLKCTVYYQRITIETYYVTNILHVKASSLYLRLLFNFTFFMVYYIFYLDYNRFDSVYMCAYIDILKFINGRYKLLIVNEAIY